jgi:hypothetical protein
MLRVREVADSDRPWLRALIEQQWGIPVVTPMAVYGAPETHDGVVAEVDGERTGAVTYVRDGDSWEVVTVISTVEGASIGRAMLEEVRRLGLQLGATGMRASSSGALTRIDKATPNRRLRGWRAAPDRRGSMH